MCSRLAPRSFRPAAAPSFRSSPAQVFTRTSLLLCLLHSSPASYLLVSPGDFFLHGDVTMRVWRRLFFVMCRLLRLPWHWFFFFRMGGGRRRRNFLWSRAPFSPPDTTFLKRHHPPPMSPSTPPGRFFRGSAERNLFSRSISHLPVPLSNIFDFIISSSPLLFLFLRGYDDVAGVFFDVAVFSPWFSLVLASRTIYFLPDFTFLCFFVSHHERLAVLALSLSVA